MRGSAWMRRVGDAADGRGIWEVTLDCGCFVLPQVGSELELQFGVCCHFRSFYEDERYVAQNGWQ